MSYKIYSKDVENKKFKFFRIVPNFSIAMKVEKDLKEIGQIHVLCLGVK